MRGFAIGALVAAALIGWAAGGGRWPALRPAPSAPHVLIAHARPAATPPAPAPAPVPFLTPGTLTIARGAEGHFFVDGDIAGTTLRFVVDTGASAVAIGRDDAQSAGINLAALDFNHEGQTAGGTTRYAPVTLPRVRVGSIELPDVQAVVLDVPSTPPLLGQSFLGRIDKVSIEGDRMTLSKL
ncbi:retropepsin-like aspartic protease family protein [Sphingomonas oligoaromativorans]|uniref:retropepsin-like aspartic protease family protein n=1 Tax=Sphingomonas oligoaromativorans TaxID=575322 RepID=UPI00141D7A3C|nr:TIGR02281 family clan AA aspartic protease [Sphingomonas oligoaromativorans]NIJ33162.1 aspartyl protease family protein [Sphingomonas oligoaromativorans]